MKKHVFITGVLAVSLLMPVGEAKAGWPTFDVAKLSSLITNLVARYQPIQPALTHINQLKTSAEQVQSFAKAVVTLDINQIGKQAQTAFKAGAFLVGDTMHYMDVAKGSNGVKDAMKNLKNDFFALDQKEVTSEDKTKIAGARVAAVKDANKEAMVTAMYMATTGVEQVQKSMEKATEAAKNASSLHDNVNAATLALMSTNFAKMNQLVVKLANMKKEQTKQFSSLSISGYSKPQTIKNYKLGEGTYSEEEKEEINVNFD